MVRPVLQDVERGVFATRAPFFRLRAELMLAGRIMAWAEAKFLRRRR